MNSNNLYVDYGFIEKKLSRVEDDVLSSTPFYEIKDNPFKHVMRTLTPDIFDPGKAYTTPAYIHPNFPINLGELVKFDVNAKFDFAALYGAATSLSEGMSLITADTSARYFYKGTKFLSESFKKNYLRAKYNQQMLIFENFQNVEKSRLDDTFFVDRNLGFLTKKASSILYYETKVSINSAISKLVPEGLGYFPPEANKQLELFITLDNASLINMLHLDISFPGDQYLDSIDYITYSIDGVNYVALDATLLKMINESFASIYDQNFFVGMVPIHPTFARYVRVGITQKLLAPQLVVNKVRAVAIEFTKELDSVTVPVIYGAPYLTAASSEMAIYMPWLFNFIGGALIFEDGGNIQYKIEMAVDEELLKNGLAELSGAERSFLKTYYKYSSAVLFNYSIFLGI